MSTPTVTTRGVLSGSGGSAGRLGVAKSGLTSIRAGELTREEVEMEVVAASFNRVIVVNGDEVGGAGAGSAGHSAGVEFTVADG